MIYNGKHADKTYGHWRVGRLRFKKKHHVTCLLCDRNYLRGLSDIVAGRSVKCTQCYGSDPTRKRALRSYPSTKNSPSWKGTKNIPGVMLGTLQFNAARRGHVWEITPEYLQKLYEQQEGKCALSGEILVFSNKSPAKASLDRIDSTQGYIEGNLQWVTKTINYMKRDLPLPDFLFWIRKILEYQS